MKTRGYMLIVILTALSVGAHANSLWTSASRSMAADSKARQVGDVVTVLVQESSSTNQKASTNFDKKLKHGNSAGVGPLVKLLPDISASSGQSGSASGTTSKSMSFSASITAKVVEVLPSGNLRLEGTRIVQTNSEKQEIKLVGTVRPQDIEPDNTVLSTYLADAEIKCNGKGPIGDRQKEGLLSKVIKFLF